MTTGFVQAAARRPQNRSKCRPPPAPSPHAALSSPALAPWPPRVPAQGASSDLLTARSLQDLAHRCALAPHRLRPPVQAPREAARCSSSPWTGWRRPWWARCRASSTAPSATRGWAPSTGQVRRHTLRASCVLRQRNGPPARVNECASAPPRFPLAAHATHLAPFRGRSQRTAWLSTTDLRVVLVVVARRHHQRGGRVGHAGVPGAHVQARPHTAAQGAPGHRPATAASVPRAAHGAASWRGWWRCGPARRRRVRSSGFMSPLDSASCAGAGLHRASPSSRGHHSFPRLHSTATLAKCTREAVARSSSCQARGPQHSHRLLVLKAPIQLFCSIPPLPPAAVPDTCAQSAPPATNSSPGKTAWGSQQVRALRQELCCGRVAPAPAARPRPACRPWSARACPRQT